MQRGGRPHTKKVESLLSPGEKVESRYGPAEASMPDGARAGDTMRIYHGVTGEVFSCAVPPGGEGQTLVVPI